MEAPPSVEGQQIVSIFSSLTFCQSNPSLSKDDSSLLPFPSCWLAPCRYDLHDPAHHTNEKCFREGPGEAGMNDSVCLKSTIRKEVTDDDIVNPIQVSS